MDSYRALMIGEKAPAFKAQTTFGMVNFPDDYKGKWLILFSHPGDFTPVCTTEIMTFASMQSDFKARNCELLGLSVDSNSSHIDWSRRMEGFVWKNIRNPRIGFPIIADEMGVVARMFGMLMPASSATKTVRTVFFIDTEGTVRAILSYPLTTGRNMKEIMRLLLALQEFDKNGNPTPADWQPGEPTLLSPPQTLAAAAERKDGSGKGAFNCLDWFICFTDGAKRTVAAAPETAMPMMNNPIPPTMTAAPETAMPMMNNPVPPIMTAAPETAMPMMNNPIPPIMTAAPETAMPMMDNPIPPIMTAAPETAMPMMNNPIPPSMNAAAPENTSAANTVDINVNIPGIRVVERQTPVKAPMPQMPMKTKIPQMPIRTKMPQTSQPAQNGRSANMSGIMQQNQLLFGSTVTTDQGTDHMLTRDYPNLGR